MKKIDFLIIALLLAGFSNAQNVGIGTATPAVSARLDVSSTSQGFLPPRMTIIQRNAIKNPAAGLVIFCIDCDELQVSNGVVWKNMSGTAACVSSTLPFIKICDQIWMPDNLSVSKYKNGDDIPQVTDATAWENLFTGAWCWYNNDSATYAAIYGKLYNWFAVNDPRGLAPAGWHIPSSSEWAALHTCLGGDVVAGGKMKEIDSTHWITPNTGASNSSGFTALPGGTRSPSGTFLDVGNIGYWWTSTAIDVESAWAGVLYSTQSNVYTFNYSNYRGFSVRCVRD